MNIPVERIISMDKLHVYNELWCRTQELDQVGVFDFFHHRRLLQKLFNLHGVLLSWEQTDLDMMIGLNDETMD